MINYPDNSQAQASDLSDQDSQYAPTPGYYKDTPPSCYTFSPSPDYHPQDGPVAPSFPRKKYLDFFNPVSGKQVDRKKTSRQNSSDI
ncbi:hypothetical protein N7470_008858 [Penicillium chermesinum]|nr:hypothetical protein N7470_008858 [Penicillium chermesinum]